MDVEDSPEVDPQGEGDDKLHYVLLLRARPAIALLPGSPGHQFLADGMAYRGHEEYSCCGWYDCLHDGDGAIVGIMFIPFDDVDALCPGAPPFSSTVRALPYVESSDGRMFDIVLDGAPPGRPAESWGEQEFGECRVYAADGGEFALFFSTAEVYRADIERFWATGADRATVGPLD